jgi:hypothetical protein
LGAIFPPFRAWQRRRYMAMFRALDRAQHDLDVCGWRELGGTCRREGNQCCSAGGNCKFLSDKGCDVFCLACKIWLCGEALAWLQNTARNPAHPLHDKAQQYLDLRRRCDETARALGIRFKGRSTIDDVFNRRKGGLQNTDLDRWYDNLYIRPWGQFPAEEELDRDRRSRSG